MKQLLILSGKGGTGKTTLAGAFIKLSSPKAYADCDVDAPNLHLLIANNLIPKSTDYCGMPKAIINTEHCIECDECRKKCRFDAIKITHAATGKKIYSADPFHCEGCGVCQYVCPTRAIDLKPMKDGELMLYKDKDSVFSTARLKMGSGTSGLLVTEVKKQMKAEADAMVIEEAARPEKLAIIDGSPGIGCPVIASLSGVDMVLIVAEPSVSGISDMERIIKTADSFGVKICVCINKYDVNLKNTEKIQEFCDKKQLAFLGVVPYDKEAVRAINEGLTVVDADCRAGESIKKIHEKTMKLLFN